MPALWDMAMKIKDNKTLIKYCEKWNFNIFMSKNCLRAICQRAKCKVKDTNDEVSKLKESLVFYELLKKSNLLGLRAKKEKSTIESIPKNLEIEDIGFLHIIATNNRLFIEKMEVSSIWRSIWFSVATFEHTV